MAGSDRGDVYDRTAGILVVETREGNREKVQGQFSASASNAGLLLEGPINKSKRGSWLVNFRKSYLQYILNRIDFGDVAASGKRWLGHSDFTAFQLAALAHEGMVSYAGPKAAYDFGAEEASACTHFGS